MNTMSKDPIFDERLQYIQKQVLLTFRNVQLDKIVEYLAIDSVKSLLYDFLDGFSTQALFFKEAKGFIEMTNVPEKVSKGTLFYVIKLQKAPISHKNFVKELIYGEVQSDALQSISNIMQGVYQPIVSSGNAPHTWTELISKEVTEKFESLVASIQIAEGVVTGYTRLPLPEFVESLGSPDKDKEVQESFSHVHRLESAIIIWTKQIKNVLKLEPEVVFSTNLHPESSTEIAFWSSKAENLNGLFAQLQNIRVRRVLTILDRSKSTYNAPFAKICKEVFHARAEANNCVKYLRPLLPWVLELEKELDFEATVRYFRPIIHITLLIWKSSSYYNTIPRLVILMREICNTVIRQATLHVNADNIFDLIDGGDVASPIKTLQSVLRIIGKFKTAYFDYKAKASVECANNQWKVQNSIIFIRLDSFLERCHDILDLAQTMAMYTKLAKIEIGGTKGKILTTSINQIYADFTLAVDAVRSVGKEVLNLENSQYDEAFYGFRNSIKELDRRLGSVIAQGLDDTNTVTGKFRVLDSFDNLISRPIVAAELEKKHSTLISFLTADMREVHKIFEDRKANPLIASNLPPVAGALSWCRGLLDRIQGPIERLNSLDVKILARDDAKEVLKLYTTLVGFFSDYDNEKVESWAVSIEATSQAKLREPLLVRDSVEVGMLRVNFDSLLVRLLREVKYFIMLGFEVPSTAMEIYECSEIFRRNTGNLDLIINMYNELHSNLLPVERPLIKAQLDKVDKALSQGLGDGKNNTKVLNWKSTGIEVFIGEAMVEVKEVSELFHMLKGNLKQIEQTVGAWKLQPLFERSPKTALVDDLLQSHSKTRQVKLGAVKEAGQEIHRLLRDTNKRLKISQGLPDWKAYVDFISNVVLHGLIDAMAASLAALGSQLNAEYLKSNNIPPLLEIHADLVENRVIFIPEVGLVEDRCGGENSQAVILARKGIKNIVNHWVNGMLGLAGVFKRLDGTEGTYLRELTDSPEVQTQVTIISKSLDTAEQNADRIRQLFAKFSYLWETDMAADFSEFLRVAVTVTQVPYPSTQDDDGDAIATPLPGSPLPDIGGDCSAGSSRKTSVSAVVRSDSIIQTWSKTAINLELFGEKIKKYLQVQSEISELKPQYDSDFLRINAQPVKQSLSTWATKWLYMYTQYLQNYIRDQLLSLNSFVNEVNQGLDQPVEGEGRDALMAIMTHIRDVRKRMPEIATIFEPIGNIVDLLKSGAIGLDVAPIEGSPALYYRDRIKMLWENTVNKAFRVKESIRPAQHSMVDNVRKEVKIFEVALIKFSKDFKLNGPFYWLETDKHTAYRVIASYQTQAAQLDERAKAINELEDLFELTLSPHSLLHDLKDDLRSAKNIWDLILLVDHLFTQWRATLWADIKTEDMLDELKIIQSQMRKQPKKAREWALFQTLEQQVRNMTTLLPMVSDLHSPALRDRHWKSLMQITHTVIDKGPGFCLEHLISSNLQRHVEAVGDVCEVANRELKIESRLRAIESFWLNTSFTFDRHRDTEVYIIAPPDDILETLEEHHTHLQNMIGMGKYVDFFREEVVKWQATLGEVETTLKLILLVQRQWSSLESIFLSSADIRAQLPDDTKRFEGVDADFKELMRALQASQKIVAGCKSDGRENVLRLMYRELEKCEKALNEYLEIKKKIFPRFYFVSNAALLDILSNGNSAPNIMPHVGSIFDGIGNLELCLSHAQAKEAKEDKDEQSSTNTAAAQAAAVPRAAKAMISKDNEVVAFPFLFEIRSAVEMWLQDLVFCMQSTLRTVLGCSMSDASIWEVDVDRKPRDEWIFTVPAQIALVTSQIVWTEEVESALEEIEAGQEDSLKKYAELCGNRLEALIRLVQGELSKADRTKVITVITIDVHNRDVVLSLITKKVENNVDFKWQSQLRYYYQPIDTSVNIRICDFSSSYSFEYVGNCGRLVITPLTDRCYVTLTVALRLNLGGAPAGPAGTGKTETTKDLARGLGLPCYVFNCSDQMNYQTMGDIFKGLTQAGAWGCFDEFNRIEIEVLSVVASQVRCILDAVAYFAIAANRVKVAAGARSNLLSKVGMFNFFGETIGLVPTLGLFITMNPGYAGRTELPENLKSLFRSCAMIQPDLLPICENMLMAEGFVKARPLSVKFVTLYKLSSELLSKQHHYDWGLRAIKSVLQVAGMLKRADPGIDEEAVLMRALRDFNTPKIPNNDINIFLRLIADLFPGLDLAPKVNASLFKTCVDVCKAQGLQPEEGFVAKVMQYQEILDVRHSVMLLGPAGSGKTSVWKTLAACHNLEKPKPVTMFDIINPKSLTTDELYGYMTLTKDWRDGVLSIVMRSMSKNTSPYSSAQSGKWVVLDGDIDAVWIESMNTVMDDNKMLTLVSNERIPLTESMRMVFEVHSLSYATPATVSRAGILYINDTDVGYRPFIDSWIASRLSDSERSILAELFAAHVDKLFEFLYSIKAEMAVALPAINMVQSLCFLLDGMMSSCGAAEKSAASITRMFFFSAMWSFGGILSFGDRLSDPRRAFSNLFKTLSKTIRFPDTETIFDYFIDQATGEVTPWQNNVPKISTTMKMGNGGDLFVPTAETVRLTYLMDLLVRTSKPVMLVGSAGTGKTMLVNDYLSAYSSKDESLKFETINMNYYSNSLSLQYQLEQSIEKRSGKTYGPTNGRLVYFVDDMNLPMVETYGTQTPIALMRQHIDNGAWFDRSDMSLKKTIVDCQYVACMNHKSGSFTINPRLQRHFVTLLCQMPGENDLISIFGTILRGHLSNFDKKVQDMAKNLTDATIALHKEVLTRFLPSAVKFHYNFNMRDLASVFRGLLNSEASSYRTTAIMTRLWYHEVCRVFADRLVSENETARFKEIVVNIGKRFVEDKADVAYADPCTFTHFVNEGQISTYLPCEDSTKLKKELDRRLREYNESNSIMNLVLFDQAMRHIARITRILMFPGGNALLVGVGGNGKRSLSKLAAHICQYDSMQISVTSEYTINDFRENLKDMFRKAAVKPGLPLVFILNDTQITDEMYLVYLNDLLSSGRIPDLFSKDEYDQIFTSLRSAAKSEGVPENRFSMMNFFITRVRANLHVILCFSPVGDTFRQYARKFPGIINCTSIDWFHEWPKDALVSVARHFLDDVKILGRSDIRDSIAYHVAEVHASVIAVSAEYLKEERRYNYSTPKSFLDLILYYKTLLALRRGESDANIKRLTDGLETLQRTNHDVAHLQEFLKEKQKEVEAKRAATDVLLQEMGAKRSEAEAQQALADKERVKADKMADEARKLEAQAEGDLAMARPALDAANEAVNCLDKASMTELKSFTKPPPGVEKVTTALLIMIKFEKKDFSWENAKKMMAKVDGFKEKLENYRGESIPDDVISRVTPMMSDADFNYERMKTKSLAAANLVNWVVNIITFNQIYKRVKPLMDSLDVAKKAKKKADEDLAVVNENLAAIEEKINKLQQEFILFTEEKAKVEKEAQGCRDKLAIAERLTSGLSSENERWAKTVHGLVQREENIPGDVMLAASFTSYIGAFGAKFRQKLWKDIWYSDLKGRSVPISPNFDPLWVLTTESLVALWQNQGLPSDRISVENGALITNCSRWPLLIDPQLQGIRWLKKYEEARTEANGRKLIVIRPGQGKWMSVIISAIQTGDTVILENCGETLDASLDPILSKAIYKKGRASYLKIGEGDVQYDDNFRFYLQTKFSNPHLKPEIFTQCTLINFIVTKGGLEDQLLANIVSEEEPELEATKIGLVKALNSYKIQLMQLEDDLLERLANAPEDILSDIPLVESLEKTKVTALEITEAVAKAKETEVGINQAREAYRLVAMEASLLYFVILQLSGVNHMYQYSLDSFVLFFLKALKQAKKAIDKTTRVNNLQSTLRWVVFKWVVRGLFEEHRLILLTQLTFSLMQHNILGSDSGFSTEGLRFLLTGASSSDDKSPVSWLSDTAWGGLRNLSTLDGFERLSADVEENSPRFFEWFQSFTPELERLPGDWRELDKYSFKKLLAIRFLRPDRLTVALTNFIKDLLPAGKDFVECDSQLNSFQVLEQSFEDSTPEIPLYFILSPGSDVVTDVDKLAAKNGKVKGVDYHNISLGQGQDAIAAERLEMGNRQGHWVFLNNVHLMPRWLHVLEKKLDGFATSGTTHPDFRVMLSSDPSTSVPVSILDRSIKITSDPPSGLKANLKQAFACYQPDAYEELEQRSKAILFGLCQFHAVMVERKKFGAKGFNMMYPFSVGDLVCSTSVLKNYMESAPPKVPWADLRYLFGEIMYGGHIVNDFDRLLANTYLEFFMRDELLDEMTLYPYFDASANPSLDVFRAPSVALAYDKVLEHIEDTLKAETPAAYGLHPNAEIGFRTHISEALLSSILQLSTSSGDAAAVDMQGSQQVAEMVIQDVLESLRDIRFEITSILSSIDEVGPFQNIILQECERMNALVTEIVRSLTELDLGFRGDLTISDAMEELAGALYLDRVPKRWEALAYPSLRPLGAWLADLQSRIAQLYEWTASPTEMPVVTWICGLFNPQSFLTAVMQSSAQAYGLELDRLVLLTEFTKKVAVEDFNVAPKEGTYIVGLYLEGGSWNIQSALLEPSKPREMHCLLPVIHVKPVLSDGLVHQNIFHCPVYKTQQRGGSGAYVTSIQLKTKFDPAKWILAGVVAVMEIS